MVFADGELVLVEAKFAKDLLYLSVIASGHFFRNFVIERVTYKGNSG